MMNSIERVFTVVSGGTPDRVPVSLTTSLYGAALLKCPLEEYYRNAEFYAAGQALVAEKCSNDIIFSPFTFALFAEACGATLAFRGYNAPVVKENVEYTPGKNFRLDVDLLLDHPSSRYILESVKKIAADSGKEKVIAGINISPCDLPALIFGVEKWLHTLIYFPADALSIIRNLGEYYREMSKQMYARGAHLTVSTLNFTNPQIVTRDIAGYILPEIKNLFDQIEGPKVIHHGGPDISDAVSDYLGLSGTVGFVISPRDRIYRVREKAEDKILLGNIDGPFLARQTPASIRQRCRKILDENAGNARFILCSSNADIAYETPLENILAVSHAARCDEG